MATNPSNVILSRRSAIVGGVGLLASFQVPLAVGQEAATSAPSPVFREAPLAQSWIRINPNGRVDVLTGKVEIGQGVLTALAQIVAQELDVALHRMAVRGADTAISAPEFPTVGSLSIEQSGGAFRMAATEVRSHLLARAAQRLRSAPHVLTVVDGVVQAPNGEHLTYWTLVEGAPAELRITGSVQPKATAVYSIVGRPVPRLDLPAKLSGQPSYLVDLRLPGMLHGRIVRPPSQSARLASLDPTSVRDLPGVSHVVRDGSFLGVVAAREEQAIEAAEALREAASWSSPTELSDDSAIYALMREKPAETVMVESKTSRQVSSSGRRLSATYLRPFQAHASMGPSCAIAHWRDGGLTIWHHSQHTPWVRQDLAFVLGLSPERVRLVFMPHAGSFGHNGQDDVMLDAALLAREARAPVRVMWSRSDEMSWAPFGSSMIVDITGDVGPDGRLADYRHAVRSFTHVWQAGRQFLTGASGTGLLAAQHLERPFPLYPAGDAPASLGGGGERNAVPIYDVPSVNVVKHLVNDPPLRVSALRALGAYANIFAMESFMDEAASVAGVDPVEFRLRHLVDERWRSLIKVTADRAGWSEPLPHVGRGRGFAFARYKNTAGALAIAVVVEVDRDTGAARVEKATAAVDVGLAINPLGVKDQIEGGIIQAISWTLHEQVRYAEGRVTSTDFSSYPILSVADAPEIDIHVMERSDLPPLGVGETAQGPTAAAIANAIFAACRARVREIPITPERILAVRPPLL